MPSKKNTLTKLTAGQVDSLKGKLLEVRRIGSKPIFIKVTAKSTIKDALKNADIPTQSSEIKVEGLAGTDGTWEEVSLTKKAIKYDKIAVTTKVSGA